MPIPRWLHYWAILTVAAALVLLPVGALVTTVRAGMADAAPVRPPWYLPVYLATTPWQDVRIDYLIEHSHRFFAYLVGLMTIVLAVGSWGGTPRWVAWLGTSALLAVIAQGVLGALRVWLNQHIGPEMAAVHGVFGALVFSLLVSIAVLTGRRPTEALDAAERRRFARMALLVTHLVLLQLIFGALVRHTYFRSGPRLHLFGAFAVLAVATWLARAAWESPKAWRRLGRSVAILMVLVMMQIALGVEAWLSKFSEGMHLELQLAPSWPQVVVRTAHFLLGSCILAASTATLLLARRSPAPVVMADEPARESVAPLRPRETLTTAAARLEGTA